MKNSRYSVPEMKRKIDVAWLALVQLCEANELRRPLGEALDVELKAEREHRAMGARLTGGRAGYRISAAHAAKLLVIRHVTESERGPVEWDTVLGIRYGVVLAYGIRAALAKRATEALERALPTLQAAAEIDYADDVAA